MEEAKTKKVEEKRKGNSTESEVALFKTEKTSNL